MTRNFHIQQNMMFMIRWNADGTTTRVPFVRIAHDEEEERRQRLKAFDKVIEIYCENLKSRTSQSTGQTKKEEKI